MITSEDLDQSITNKGVRSCEEAVSLEREAHQFRESGEAAKAFSVYDEAALIYRDLGEHLKAAVCYAAAATCWDIHSGRQLLRNSATRSHYAAAEAMKAKHYDYARTLFREAAMLYEEEGDFENYSECFLASQRAGGKRSWAIAMGHGDTLSLNPVHGSAQFLRRIGHFLHAISNVLVDLVWGFGERPFRALGTIFFVIVGSAIYYSVSGEILVDGSAAPRSFLDGLYFSVSTMTTVGYGDFLPLGWSRAVAMGEALAGIILLPLFLIALTRSYLRMYR